MELNESERIALIKNAYLANQGFITHSEEHAEKFQELVEDLKAETLVCEHGLLDNNELDIEDEKQFLNSDVAEDIAEEEEEMDCVSDQMKGVYS